MTIASAVDRAFAAVGIPDDIACRVQSGRMANKHRRRIATRGRNLPVYTPPPTELSDAAWLRRAYLDEGRSMIAISCDLGVGYHSVRNALMQHGITIYPRGNPVLRRRSA